jgi:hypothetical protein
MEINPSQYGSGTGLNFNLESQGASLGGAVINGVKTGSGTESASMLGVMS